jgi:hypothetical protein
VGQYLVELYLSRTGAGDLDAVVARASAAAADLSREGVPVSCLRSIFVPADETWFLLYEGPSPAEVLAAVVRAGLRCERVLDAVTQP